MGENFVLRLWDVRLGVSVDLGDSLFGTIQYRVIKSVLMTSRPPIIDDTLCQILHMTYSRVYINYIL